MQNYNYKIIFKKYKSPKNPSIVYFLINPSTDPDRDANELPAETLCLDSYELAPEPGLSSTPERLRFQQCKAYAYENNYLTLSSGASWLQIEGPDAAPGNVCNYNWAE